MNEQVLLGDVIQRIVQDYGEKALPDIPFMTKTFAALAPGRNTEQEQLKAFLLCGGAETLLQIRRRPAREQQSSMDNLVRRMTRDHGIGEKDAWYVCTEFYRGITGCEWTADSGESRESLPEMKPEVPESIAPFEPDSFPEHPFFPDPVELPDTIPDRSRTVGRKSAGKRWVLPALAAAGILLAGGLFALKGVHKHVWKDATCTAAQVCEECGETSGNALGHAWKDATCTDAEICRTCGLVRGSALGHRWQDATQTQPKTCSTCGRTDGLSLQEYAEQEKQQILEQALASAGSGRYREAIRILDEAWAELGYQEFYDLSVRCRREFGLYVHSVVAAGKYNSIIRYPDGTVYIEGDGGEGERKAEDWTDTIALCMGDRFVLALCSDGTVLMEGEKKQRGVREWQNVVAIAAGDVHSVALLEDGTVKSVGYCDMGQYDDEALMANAGDREIVAIAAGYHQTLALLEDGRVVAVGTNRNGACNVFGWRDIAAICAGTRFSAGLKTDGTVVVTDKTWDVSDWTDIVMLSAGDFFLLGLREDGTVLAVGDYGLVDVSEWQNIVHIAAGHDHAVAVDADGNVYSTGSNEYGQYFEDGTNAYRK